VIAERLGATPAQLAVAWLLRRSPAMLPIPGTSSVAHLDENVASAAIELADEQFEALAAAA
jgi:aryl-alcohol dehydrogenase-like predicted oxidoreductase